MIAFDVTTFGITLAVLSVILSFMKYTGKFKNMYLLFFSVFYIYLVHVLKYTIFPIPVQKEYLEHLHSTFGNIYAMQDYNIIPFKSNYNFADFLLSSQVLLNVLLSIPFGFGISYIMKMNKKKIIILSVLFGVTIEMLQFIISLLIKYSYRCIDINDIIFNGVGVIIGYLCFKCFSLLAVKIINAFKIEPNLFIKYICEAHAEQ